MKNRAQRLLVAALMVMVAGCATNKKPQPTFERGWIGGKYKLAHTPRFFGPADSINTFPRQQITQQKTGLLVVGLCTNAPAQMAGLREGDLILEVDHRAITRLADFRRIIDETKPGNWLPIKAYRSGAIIESRVRIGRETYRRQGNLMIVLPFIANSLNFGTQPGLSLVFAGYQSNAGFRTELESVEQTFARACNPKGGGPYDEDWKAWLVIAQVSKGKVVLSQDLAPAQSEL